MRLERIFFLFIIVATGLISVTVFNRVQEKIPPARPFVITPTPTQTPSPFPKLLADIPLAPPDENITDLILDSEAKRLYVTDSAGQLHIVDTTTYNQLITLPATGKLTLDTDNQRLYISPEEAKQLTIVDTAAMTITGIISPGGFVAVDSSRNRFYVGNRTYRTIPGDEPGVRVYDSDSLKKLAEVSQPGIPIYNPIRDELYIVAQTLYPLDPDSLKISADDLLPDVMKIITDWCDNCDYICNGCPFAKNAYIFPDHNLLVVDISNSMVGKGVGNLSPPRFFNAATLTELTDLSQQPIVERDCMGDIILSSPVGGHIYREKIYSRYTAYSNLLVYDIKGNLVDWRDGLALGVTNPRTGQMYYRFSIIDLGSLTPIGQLPALPCFLSVEGGTGFIYGINKNRVMIFSETGGKYAPSISPRRVRLPFEGEIQAIYISPNYNSDKTLFINQHGRLYRSRNEGRIWLKLGGGLPDDADGNLNLKLVFSPDFANDKTLFIGGYYGDFMGAGVYRSTDRGDSWQPLWQNLTNLRVTALKISPTFAKDDTLLAYTRYKQLTSNEQGESIFRSTDRGLNWSLVLTKPIGSNWPYSSKKLLPNMPTPPIRFRRTIIDTDEVIQRTLNGGRSWKTALRIPASETYTYIQTILTSPNFTTDKTVYALSYYDLFRSTDRGNSWQKWIDKRLQGRSYTNTLQAISISPSLTNKKHKLFIGTVNGEFWSLEPKKMIWGAAIPPPAITSRALPKPTRRPRPTRRPKPTRTPTSKPANISVSFPYADIWNRLGGKNGPLGDALSPAVEGSYASQPFAHGFMHWGWKEKNISYVHILYYGANDNYKTGSSWQRYRDTWQEGEQEYFCSQAIPPFGPKRGFGKVWCSCPECRNNLDSPLEPEQGKLGGYQTFNGGVMLWDIEEKAIYVLFNGGGWQRFEY